VILSVVGWLVGGLFYDVLSVTALYSDDDKVISE
jgi:hypothetical protein